MRYLFAMHRHVPLDRADDYLVAWTALRTATETAGGHAWVFQGTTHEDRFLELIEWSEPATPLDDVGVTAALTQLEGFGPATEAAEWEEAT
jgi:hypothetical protein